jgi:tetratricopeptide (TPR) repeat protein
LKKSSSDETTNDKPEPKEEVTQEVTLEDTQEVSQEEPQDQNIRELVVLETHLSIGDRFFHEEHDYIKAIEEYTLAIDESDDETIKLKANYMMAECYAKMEKYKEAKEIFESIAVDSQQHYLRASAKRRLEHLSDYLVVD